MRAVHDLLWAQAEHWAGITLAAILLLVDGERDRWRDISQRKNRSGLGEGDDAFFGAHADAPFLVNAASDAQAAKDDVKQTAQDDGEDRAE